MNRENVLEEYDMFKTKGGKELYLVKFHEPAKLQCWKPGRELNELIGRVINIHDVSTEELKRLKIWNKLTAEVQKDVEEYEIDQKNRIHNKMSIARSKKRERYVNIPREIECTKCKTKQKVPPGLVAKRVESSGKMLDEWLKVYQCQKCKPTRGRQIDPKYAHLPKELTCKCGSSVTTSASAIVSRAEKLKLTPEEFVKGYQCQKCNPTKGRGKQKKQGKQKRKGKK